MKKYALLILACLGSHLSSLHGEIIEVQHFEEIISYVTKDTLIILDIDDTLLVPSQMLGCDEWFRYRLEKHRKEGMLAKDALEKSLAEWEGIRHFTKMEMVEPGSDGFVYILQAQGFCVMGLTTQRLALATRTAQQLKAHQIDLSLTAPQEEHHFLVRGHGILYRSGILFTSGTPKGEALFKLCEDIGYLPKRIVFLNDKASHLAEVETEAKKREIAFIGLRYAYSDVRKASFRSEIAEVQFAHSTFEHLLSDEEAQGVLTKNLTCSLILP